MHDLDPNAPSWQRIIERDAAMRFTGDATTDPFGSALYLWGNTAIYCIQFTGWTPLSGAKAAQVLLEAHHEVREHLPQGQLAFYVQLPPAILPKARKALSDAFADLPLTGTLVIIGNRSTDWQRLDVWQTMEF